VAAPNFDRQQHAIEANGGRPLDGAQLNALRDSEQMRRLPAAANTHGALLAPTPTPATAASTANVYRRIPERSPQFQPPAPKLQSAPQDLEQNVFERRDREIEQEHEAQQREQKIQQLQQQRVQQQHFQSQQQEVQRLQEQQRIQEQQQQVQQQRQLQSTPPSQPLATPHASPRPDFRRVPEQYPPAPSSSR
jgi:hypothetical protein